MDMGIIWQFICDLCGIYPLVNCYTTMENHYFSWKNSLFHWGIFNSYFDITRWYMGFNMMYLYVIKNSWD